jgi:hypothetical protein
MSALIIDRAKRRSTLPCAFRSISHFFSKCQHFDPNLSTVCSLSTTLLGVTADDTDFVITVPNYQQIELIDVD